MTDFSKHKAALLKRLSELDKRLHDIEAELDAPHSKDWDEAAVEHEGFSELMRLSEKKRLEELAIYQELVANETE